MDRETRHWRRSRSVAAERATDQRSAEGAGVITVAKRYLTIDDGRRETDGRLLEPLGTTGQIGHDARRTSIDP